MTRRGKKGSRPGSVGWVLAAAFLVRCAALWAASGAEPLLDEQLYAIRAEALLEGRGFVGSYQSWVRYPGSPMMAALPQYPGAYQPPLYTAFVAAVMASTGGSLVFVRLAQVVLSTLTVWIVYATGRSWFGHRQGLVAAAVCAFYPNLIAFSHYLWSETLFVLLLACGAWILTRERSPAGLRDPALAGAVLGLAALTRGSFVYLLPLLGAWIVASDSRRWRSGLARAAALLLAAAIVIAPWAIRNTVLHGGFVLIDTNGAFNLWRGNAPDTFADRPQSPEASYAPPFRSLPLMPVAAQNQRRFLAAVSERLGIERPTDLQIVRAGKALAWEQIRRHPLLFVRRAPTKLVDLWNPTSFLLRQFRLGAYGKVGPAWEALLSWSAVAGYLLVMIFAVPGFLSSLGDRRAWLVLVLVLFVTATSVIAFGLTRFRLPVMPFLILLAARGACVLLDRGGEARLARARGGAA